MKVLSNNAGPSTALVEWSNFIFRCLVCSELVVAIAFMGFRANHGVLSGLGVAALVATVLKVLNRNGSSAEVTAQRPPGGSGLCGDSSRELRVAAER